ncbi:hypothetical protein [Paenibacillus dendritiformis]|uniref:hypothetical protein n=1 Tax=Paenibacillus dendritiformis TaxID=130049 RepID=UPI00387E0C23
MKLTLFTISNEQIKEQLSKLQTKVESLETMRDVQDKIISAKDSQIAFLNGQIANISTWVSIVAAVAGLIASFAFGYVTYLNKKANKNIEEGKERDRIAEVKIQQAETLIAHSQSTATIAQDKIEELKEKQKDLNNFANTIAINQQLDMNFRIIKIQLDTMNEYINMIIDKLQNPTFKINDKEIEELDYFMRERNGLSAQYVNISLDFHNDIRNGEELFSHEKNSIEELTFKCDDLFEEFVQFKNNIDKANK